MYHVCVGGNLYSYTTDPTTWTDIENSSLCITEDTGHRLNLYLDRLANASIVQLSHCNIGDIRVYRNIQVSIDVIEDIDLRPRSYLDIASRVPDYSSSCLVTAGLLSLLTD